MSDDPVDYDDLVDNTIDDVKKRIEDEDLDLEQVRDAEAANRNRVTLIEWLDQQIADQEAEGAAAAMTGDAEDLPGGSDTAPYTGGEDRGMLARLKRALTSRFFISGFVLGALLLGAVASMGGVPTGQAAMPPAEASQQLQTYFDDNAAALGNTSVTVADVQQVENTELYEASLEISIPGQNGTVPQNAFVTQNARFVFLGQPIDTSQPLADQVGGQQAPQ